MMPDVVSNPDCSELAATLTRLALGIGTDPKFDSLEKITNELNRRIGERKQFEEEQNFAPEHRTVLNEFSRQEIVDSINEAVLRRKAVTDETKKQMARLKREARTDETVKKAIGKFQTHLELGENAAPIPAKKASPEDIKAQRADLKELRTQVPQPDEGVQKRLRERLAVLQEHVDAGTIPPKIDNRLAVDVETARLRALRDGLQEKINNSPAAEKARLEAQIPKLKEQIEELQHHRESGTLPEPLKRERPMVEEVAQLRDVRNHLAYQIRAKAALEQRIGELEQHIKAGTVPQPEPLVSRPVDADIVALRAKRDEVLKAVQNSEPALKARITDQITRMTQRLEENQFAPQVRSDPFWDNPDLRSLLFQRDKHQMMIRRQINALRPKTAWDAASEAANVVRGIKGIGGFHVVMRTLGAQWPAHPLLAAKSFAKSLEGIGSEQKSWEIGKQIESDPAYALLAKRSADLPGVRFTTMDGPLGTQDESFMGNWLGKIPLSKQLKRGYNVYGNLMRLSIGKTFLETLTQTPGLPTPVELRDIQNAINQGSGRGSIKGFEASMGAINTWAFSARQLGANFATAIGQPVWSASGAKMRTGIFLDQYVRRAAGLAAVYGLASAAGVQVTPQGRMVFGDHQLDIAGGMTTVARLLFRAGNSTYRTLSGQQPDKLKFGEHTLGDDVSGFVRGHLAPTPAIGWDIMSGHTFEGDATSPYTVLRDLVSPLSYKDLADVMKENGIPTGTVLELIAILGGGIEKPRKRSTTGSVNLSLR